MYFFKVIVKIVFFCLLIFNPKIEWKKLEVFVKKKIIIPYQKVTKKEGSIGELLVNRNGISHRRKTGGVMKAHSGLGHNSRQSAFRNLEWEELFVHQPVFEHSMV